MNTYRSNGKTIAYANASGDDIASGDLVCVGDMVGVAVADIADGADGVLSVDGEHEVAATSGEAWSQGDQVYGDPDTAALTAVASGNVSAGKAAADKASADTVATVLLNR